MNAAAAPAAPLLSAHGISKSYGHVRALDEVDFDIDLGEVVALVGDNGAGKSTLTKVLCGAVQPDEGEVRLDGSPVAFRSPRDARDRGVTVVYQDLALVDSRSVAHNVFLGAVPTRGLVVDRQRMHREARDVLDQLKIQLPSVRSPRRRSVRSRLGA